MNRILNPTFKLASTGSVFLCTLFFLSITACKKDVQKEHPIDQLDPQNEFMILGSDNGTINLYRLADPTPIVDTLKNSHINDSSYIVFTEYGFDLYSRFDAMQIVRDYGYPVNTSNQRDFINSVGIRSSWIVVAEKIDTSTISLSNGEDSLYNLSQSSPYSNLPILKSVYPTPGFYAMAFDEGDTIFRLGDKIETSGNVALITGQGEVFHHSQKEETYYSYTDSINKYRFWDLYYPHWKGLSEKYIVFSASLDEPIPKLGWIKLSIGEQGELTVHEVAYEVD
jgi:hypothetical protein